MRTSQNNARTALLIFANGEQSTTSNACQPEYHTANGRHYQEVIAFIILKETHFFAFTYRFLHNLNPNTQQERIHCITIRIPYIIIRFRNELISHNNLRRTTTAKAVAKTPTNDTVGRCHCRYSSLCSLWVPNAVCSFVWKSRNKEYQHENSSAIIHKPNNIKSTNITFTVANFCIFHRRRIPRLQCHLDREYLQPQSRPLWKPANGLPI